MNKITKSFLTLLLLGAGVVSAQAQDKDAWFTGADGFRFRAQKNATEEPYAAFSDKVEPGWGADPADATNGCIVAVCAPGTATTSQLWIRGAKVGEEGFTEGKGFKVTMRVKADAEYSEVTTTAHKAWGWFTNAGFDNLNVTKDWQTVSILCVATAESEGFTDLCLNLSGDAQRTFYFDDVKIEPYPAPLVLMGYKAKKDAIYTMDFSTAESFPFFTGMGHPDDASYDVDTDKGTLVINNVAPETCNPWDLQLFVGDGITLEDGKDYQVRLTLKSESAGEIQVNMGTWGGSNQYLTQIEASEDFKTYSVDFPEYSGEAASNVHILYQGRKINGTVEIAKVEVYELEPVYGEVIYTMDFGTAESFPFFTGMGHPDDASYDVDTDKGTLVINNVAPETCNPWDLQLFVGDGITLEDGKDYQVRLTLKSESAGEIQVNMGTWGGSNQYLTQIEASEDFKTYSVDFPEYSGEAASNVHILYQGRKINGTVEIAKVEVLQAKDAGPAPELVYVELLENGDIESAGEHVYFVSKEYDIDPEALHNARVLDGIGKDDSKGIEVRSADKVANPWDSQFWIYVPYKLPSGTKAIVEFDYKASKAGSVGTQAHELPSAFLGNGMGNVAFTTEWQHFKYEGRIGSKNFQSLAFNLNDFAEGDIFYFDNFSFKVDQSKISGDPNYLSLKDYPNVEYTDPATLTYSDLLVEDFEGDADANENFLSKLVLGHTEQVEDPDTGEKTRTFVFDDTDPEILPAVKSEVAANWIAEGEEVELGKYGLNLAVKQQTEGGNEKESQFFIRLPKALPADALVNVEFDYWASQDATVNTGAQTDPGQDVDGGKGIGTLKFTTKQWAHFQKYVKVAADMRTIVFNMSGYAAGATYRFDNFKIQIAEDFVAAAEELTKTMDETSLWADYTLPLYKKINEAKNTETEGYTEESVKALTDAIAAGKDELANAEATAESLAAAKQAVEDAIAGLEKPVVLEDCDLTTAMFFRWDAVDETAAKTGETGCAYDVNKDSEAIYGDMSVNEYNFADLSAYDHLAITVSLGEPRLLFNRAAQDDHQGPVSVELPRDNKGEKKYEVVIDNGDGTTTYVINLKAIVEKDGYAHLHAIKGADWKPTNVSAMKLFVGESEYTDALTGIEGVAEGASAKDGKYFINGQIVIVKGGKKYNAAGVEIK